MSKKRTKKSTKKYAKRLLSYTTAAGVGAFGAAENAEGAIQFFDIPDVTMSSLPPDVDVQFRDERYLNVETGEVNLALDPIAPNQLLFRTRYRPDKDKNIDGTGVVGDRAVAGKGATQLVKVAMPYYVDVFYAGELIDASTTDYPDETGIDPQVFLGGLSYGSSYNYSGFPFGDGPGGVTEYVAFSFKTGMGPSAVRNYGWVEVETDAGASSMLPATITIKSLALELTPDTGIIAGDKGVVLLPGDFNGDGVVDGLDFLKWQRSDTPGGGSQAELTEWEANFGSPLVAAVNSVPEPATLALLAAGAGAFAFASRRRSS